MSGDAPDAGLNPSSPAYLTRTVKPPKPDSGSSRTTLKRTFRIEQLPERIPLRIAKVESYPLVLRELQVLEDTESMHQDISRNYSLFLVVPVDTVEFCKGRSCEDCFHWPICHVGRLPVGHLFRGRVAQYHFKKSCCVDGHWKSSGLVSNLTFHIDAHVQHIYSSDKDKYFPEMRKDEKGHPVSSHDVYDHRQ